MIFKNKKTLKKVMDICHFTGRGLHKRIDENRELLQFLYKEAPEFMEKFHWIEGWIKGADVFYLELEKALDFPKNQFGEHFPRPWTGKKYDDSSNLYWPSSYGVENEK